MSSLLEFRQREEWLVVGFTSDRLTEPSSLQQIQVTLFSTLQRLPLRGQVAISFEGVDHASSQVVGLLLGAKKIVTDRFGTLVLCRVGEHLAEVFRLTRLDRQFEIKPRLRDVIGTSSAPTSKQSARLVRTGASDPQWID